MLYVFFWVITRRLNFICRHFGTLCLFHLHRLPAYEDGTECSETKIQMPGNYSEENIQQGKHFFYFDPDCVDVFARILRTQWKPCKVFRSEQLLTDT